MLCAAKTAIGPDEHTPSLAARLSELGAGELLRVLRDRPAATPQDDDAATYAAKIQKQEGEVRFTETTAAIYNRFRAFDPWPGVFTGDLKFLDMRPAEGSGEAGSILRIGEGVVVATADGAIELLSVQRSGKARTTATEFARSAQWRVGARLRG
jgi:methionyl-tRNA formyltransferase